MTLQAALRRYCKHVIQEGTRPVGLRHRIDDVWRMARSLRSQTPVSTPPHSLRHYAQLLASLTTNPRCVPLSLPGYAYGMDRSRHHVNYILRHDLDAGDANVAGALCDVERQ